MRTRTRFLLLVLSILVPSFIASALAVAYVYRDAQEAQNRGMAETARAMALLVDNELEKKEQVLRALAASPALAEGRIPTFYKHASSVVPPPARSSSCSTSSGTSCSTRAVLMAASCRTARSRTCPN
jgi:hypothetical protein